VLLCVREDKGYCGADIFDVLSPTYKISSVLFFVLIAPCAILIVLQVAAAL
jgi:hypothetical protein